MAALISVSAPFGSCQKEQKEFTRLELVAEGFQNNDNGAKLTVDGVSSTWVDGEKVRINDNGPLTISYTSGASASVAGDFTTPIRAIYPASICTGDLTSSTTTVTLPSEYQYATLTVSGGIVLQSLQSPMAAYSAIGNQVHFKHLTGALVVKVTNSTGANMYIDAITVTSSKYQLSGTWNVDFDDLTGTGTPVATATEADRSVTLNFEGTYVSLGNGNTRYYQIPVPPVGDDHDFTVKVSYHPISLSDLSVKQWYTRTLSQTSGSGHALERDQLGYVPVAMAASGEEGVTADWMPKDSEGNYLIGEANHLRVLSANSETATELNNASYKLMKDIDASSVTDFVAIHKCDLFDGQEHTISNLTINSKGNDCGMFRTVGSSTVDIKNLTLTNPKLKTTTKAYSIGTFISNAYTNSVNITNCTVNNLTVDIADNVNITRNMGGLVGEQAHNINITLNTCKVDGFSLQTSGSGVIGGLCFGGMVGYFANTGSARYLDITDCQFTIGSDITVTGNFTFGGLLGEIESGSSTHVRPTNCTVNTGNRTFTINSSIPQTFFVGSMVGKDNGTAATITIGGASATNYTGNVTSGHITTEFSNVTGTKYIGNSTNNYVCGTTKVNPPNNQDASTLNLTIE